MTVAATDQMELKVKFFRGFGEKTRLAILEALKDGEKTVSEIVEFTAGNCGNQPNISHHLSCLRGCGILKSRQAGKHVYYSIRNKEIEQFLLQSDAILKELVGEMDVCCENEKLVP